MSDADIAAAALLLSFGAAGLAALHRVLEATAFDPTAARAAGLRPDALRLALLGLLAIAVAVAVQGLGALLVLAVLVAPPVAVRGHATTPARTMVAGSAVAVLAGVVGIEVSFHAGSAAGASIALALCAAAPSGPAARPPPSPA